MVRGLDESPPLDQPKRSLSVRLECRELEEVKSTVQARYTTTYIAYGDVCETQTYDVS